jgi:hypothetical protein
MVEEQNRIAQNIRKVLVCGVGLTIPLSLHHYPYTELLIVHIPKEKFLSLRCRIIRIIYYELGIQFCLASNCTRTVRECAKFYFVEMVSKIKSTGKRFHIDLQLSTFIEVLDFDFGYE